eukprot:TRINITY_DN2881_c0_g1_i1.p1 TRINITY_DN2881_c0_g1~~TRINITY_DN2881_c0_g1_i1.p1  ORF type:complete len:307 (+),score=110.14 TRINITY_DN2881_c0_g1_i1:454-1374(+)
MATLNLYSPFQLPFVLPQEFYSPSNIIPSSSSSSPSFYAEIPSFSILEGELSKEDSACEMLLNLKNELPSTIRFKVDEGLVIKHIHSNEAPSEFGNRIERIGGMNRKRSHSETDNDRRENRPRSISLPSGSQNTFVNTLGEKPITNRSHRSISVNSSKKQKISALAIDSKPLNGPEIALTHQARWMERYLELKEYKEIHSTCNVTFAKEHESYKTLAYWVSNQRISFRKRNMPQERVELLKSIGFDFNQTGRENGPNDNSSESGSDGEKKQKTSASKKTSNSFPKSSGIIRPGDSFPRLPSPFGYL